MRAACPDRPGRKGTGWRRTSVGLGIGLGWLLTLSPGSRPDVVSRFESPQPPDVPLDAGDVDRMALDHAREGLAIDAEDLGGALLVASRVVEHADEIPVLDLAQGQPGVVALAGRLRRDARGAPLLGLPGRADDVLRRVLVEQLVEVAVGVADLLGQVRDAEERAGAENGEPLHRVAQLADVA